MLVLLVDDEPFVVEGVAHMLSEMGGMEIEKCCTAQEALAAIHRRSPDLMIVDIEMPEMNGLKLIRTAREAGCQAKVIMLTGYSDYEYMRDALKLDIFDYVLKINGLKAVRESVLEAVAEIKENEEVEHNISAVEILKEYIPDHLQENLSLTSLSSLVYLNPSYLSRVFRQETGQRLMDYIQNVRLNKACELLATSNMQIQEIAREVGLENASYFNVAFRKKLGVSPAQWKKAHVNHAE